MKGALGRIVRGESTYDFVGNLRRWMLISGIVLLVSAGALLIQRLNLGIDFTGGTQYEVPLESDATPAEIRDALTEFELGDVKIQISEGAGGDRTALVRTPHIEDLDERGKVRAALADVAGIDSGDAINLTDIGPVWGQQISERALRGLVVFLILVIAYISFRFEPKMALAALAALFHDMIATAGIYALVGFEVTPATLIALLTLLGYSLYDTVVAFDRVKENAEIMGSRARYADIVNLSMNQVLMRSINTSLTTLLPIGALLFVGAFLLGATTLKDLALAMFVGILTGTYSSIFVASPLLAVWKDRDPARKQARSKAKPARERVAARPAPAAAAEPEAPAERPASEAAPTREPLRVQRDRPKPAQARRRKRGKKRR